MFSLTFVTLLAGLAAATPLKRSDALTVKLTPASPSVSSIDDLKLVAEVTNTGSEAIRVLKYNTVLDSLPTRSFSVSRNGTDVAFTGVKVVTGNFDFVAFHTIQSGETVSVTHSVADLFDFASAGTGTFSFTPNGEFKIAGADSAAVNKFAVDMPTVDVEVTGAIPKKVKRATNICDDSSKSSFIDSAQSEGKELATVAADYITSGDGDSVYEDYYGSTSASTIVNVFNAVADENDSGRTLSCTDELNACDGNVIAYTVTSTTDIYFCDIFFDELPNDRLCSGTSVASRNIRGGTFLHEMTHAVADTDDITYGCDSDMALSDSESAQNADNYNCFSTQAFADTQC
ncbi:zincin [Dendrothele bispora CBS 962.96]|uniref:Neutral protease 2 n=1 Tax=Dendrothele bispora (strain CBS 962.96) TaxID=1314807 RepID=A0A4S8M5A1_DENBC|nr:zincin [Dendrothele bispora CBS 962.96]